MTDEMMDFADVVRRVTAQAESLKTEIAALPPGANKTRLRSRLLACHVILSWAGKNAGGSPRARR